MQRSGETTSSPSLMVGGSFYSPGAAIYSKTAGLLCCRDLTKEDKIIVGALISELNCRVLPKVYCPVLTKRCAVLITRIGHHV